MTSSTDVHGRENCEDVGLQDRNQQFEAGQGDKQCERQDEPNLGGLPQRGGEDGEGHEDEVTGEQVGEES